MKNLVKNMCKNPVGKFARHVLTLLVSFSAANAMLQFELNWLYKYINEIRQKITLYRVVNYWMKCNRKINCDSMRNFC